MYITTPMYIGNAAKLRETPKDLCYYLQQVIDCNIQDNDLGHSKNT